MKKIISFSLCAVLLLSFSGCKSSNDKSNLSSASSLPQYSITDSSNTSVTSPSSEESIINNSSVTSVESDNVSSNTSSVVSSDSTVTNNSSTNTTSPEQTPVDDPNTITAPNGDKIYIELQKGENPSVLVKVNGKEIYSYNNFNKYKDQYDFEKDFTLNIVKEYSDENILWAYKFNWGVVYAAPYENEIVYVAGSKHEHAKKTYGTYRYYYLALELDLIDYKIMEYSGEKYYWENLPLAQSFTEYFYKTEDYELKEIEDLTEAGYDFKEYYDWHNLEFNKGIGAIYELYISGEKKALMYISAGEGHYEIQEFGWDRIKKIWVSAGNPHLNAEFR